METENTTSSSNSSIIESRNEGATSLNPNITEILLGASMDISDDGGPRELADVATPPQDALVILPLFVLFE